MALLNVCDPSRMQRPDGGESLLVLCHELVALATQRGATDVEIFAEYVKDTNVSIEQNDIKGVEVGEHHAVGIRVFVDDKMGFSYVNRFDEAALQEAVDDALTIAKTSPGDPANGLVLPEPVSPIADIWDAEIPRLSPDVVVAAASRMLLAAKEVDPRVSIDTGNVSARFGHEAIATSTGIAVCAGSTGTTYGLFGMAVDGEEVGSFDHVYQGSVRWADLRAEDMGREFGQKVVRLLGAQESKAYRGKVLFSAEAFEEIFVGTLLESADGDNITKGRSQLKGKLGCAIAAPHLKLTDDGAIPGGLGSFPFDREGLPHRRTTVVEKGVLQTYLYDGKSARRANTSPTGNASGSARSLPGIGTTNLRVAPGPHAEDALLQALDTGLFVGRFSGTTDAVSGDFSGVAKGSFWVAGGKRLHPVKETLIAGNVFVLLEQIVGMGNTLHRDYTFEGPWVLMDGVDVTTSA